MICFEPVQVSTGLPYYRRPITIKVATNLTRRVHFYWSVGDVGARVCLPALGAEGTLLAGGSPYPARPARNNRNTSYLKQEMAGLPYIIFFLNITDGGGGGSGAE